jgi:chromosome segregation ATPase
MASLLTFHPYVVMKMQAATLRHENVIAAKDSMISEWVGKQKVEQSSRQSLEVMTSALMKELESLKDSLRTTERQAMDASLKAAKEKAHLKESVHLLSLENSTLINEVDQNRVEQVVSKREIVELKLKKQGLESQIDSLSKERLQTALEVAQVNNEKASLAREKEAHQQLDKDVASGGRKQEATVKDKDGRERVVIDLSAPTEPAIQSKKWKSLVNDDYRVYATSVDSSSPSSFSL